MAEQPTPSCLGRSIRVLLTSTGNEAVHGFVDDLRRRAPGWRLIGTDMNPDSAGLYRCDHAYRVPARTDEGYLSTLAVLCERHAVDLVFPLSTRDQDYFARSVVASALGDRPIVVSDRRALACANHKIALFAHVADKGDWLPSYVVVHSMARARAALGELVEAHGAALLKKDAATAGAGMLCVGRPSRDPAPVPGRRWLSLDVVDAALAAPADWLAASLPELAGLLDEDWPKLAVAYLPGAEYSVDVLADRGAVVGGVVRQRHAAVGGLATVAETVEARDVWQVAIDVCRSVGLSYVNNIQFRRDAAGTPRLLEINPRVPGTIGLTVQAGLNLPLAACCMALGESLPLSAPTLGVRVLRHFGSVYTSQLAGPAGSDP